MSNEFSGGDGPPPVKGWIRRLWGYCLRRPGTVAVAFGSSVVGMGLMGLVPLLQKTIVDDAIMSDRRSMGPLAALLIGAGVVAFAMGYLRRISAGKLSLDVQYDLRTEMFGALSRLDGARQDELHTGQIVSRATSDITVVQGLLAMVPIMTGNLLLFGISLVVMLTLSPLLTLLALAIGPGLFFIARSARKRVFPATWDAQQEAAQLASVVDSAVTGVRVVKGFGQEARETGRLARAGRRLYASRMRAVRYDSQFNPLMQSVPALGQIGVLALGGWLAVRGDISLGTFLAFSAYLAQLVGPVRMLAGIVTVGQQAQSSAERVLEIIDVRPRTAEKPGARPLPDGAASVELDSVRFGYLPSRPVLDGLSLTVAAGETLALVGTSGSGKSTVSLLLPRFYDVQEGTVRIGGVDVRDTTVESLRSAIGLVLEDSFLFSDSVRSNIAYGRPDATEEQIVAAARAAEADQFIRALPEGYDSVVGEQGLTLSGGQRQRIALARALITDPRILLLDDATSAVDPTVEAQIHATLHKVTRDRTTILIAHRRSTLNLADRVAVLAGGRLVDVGTQEELEERCPLFRMLLSGPGDDAEGVDAGEVLATPAAASGVSEDGVTASAWDRSRVSGKTAPVMTEGLRAQAGAGRGGMMAMLSASPEMLARAKALPPATADPAVDDAAAAAPDPEFSLPRLLRPFRGGLALGLLLIVLGTLAQLAVPLLVRGGVDHGIEDGAMSAVWTVSAVGLGVLAVNWAVSVLQIRVTGRMGERLLYTLRVKIFAQLQRLGLDYYEREMSGRIMTRMTTDVDALSRFLQTGLISALGSVLSFFGILVALLVLDVELGLVVCTVLPFLIVATVFFRRASSKAYADAREKVSTVNADLQENVAGLRVAQAFRREDRNAEKFDGYNDDYRRARMRGQRLASLYFPFGQFLWSLAGALVLIVGADRVGDGTLTAGALIAYLLFIDMFFAPIQLLSQVFDEYQQATVGLDRIKDLMRTPTSTPEAASPVAVGRLKGEIVFDDVHFSYGPGVPEALSGVRLRIAAGETLALVGRTGAGKSTLVKLVARYYDVTSGAVRVDGTDVRELDLAGFRQRLGVVPQEAYLAPGTVRDAIAYGRPGATDAEVEAAARTVGAHTMIAALPGGYLHDVGERGRSLSAGQRQLVALARAQLVDPDILILDEATASLDLATEAAVTRAADRLAHRRTTLVVAHRLTTAARADRIAVLDGGRVVEVGSHDELLAADGFYARLWASFTGSEEVTV